jgi:hypothetical protein
LVQVHPEERLEHLLHLACGFVPHSCTREHSPDVVGVCHLIVHWFRTLIAMGYPSNVFFKTNVVKYLILNIII